ncbi:hypothetical protein B0H13DRAFT_2234362 [Mycena leptocephala]|nr:hypothetical protein B0H13DRAFT_2234362 [Mycena leptocephala]
MDRITQLQDSIQQLLTVMTRTVAYYFVQVGATVPITKQRNPEKLDLPDVFNANKKELVADLILKAKEVEYLIKSMPPPESEEDQVSARLQALDLEMVSVNAGCMAISYRGLHMQITDVLRLVIHETDDGLC